MEKLFLTVILVTTLSYSVEKVESYKMACEAGNARGCYNLGVMYLDGQGVSQNIVKAKKLFSKGCAYGDSYSCSAVSYTNSSGSAAKPSVRGMADIATSSPHNKQMFEQGKMMSGATKADAYKDEPVRLDTHQSKPLPHKDENRTRKAR